VDVAVVAMPPMLVQVLIEHLAEYPATGGELLA
jgi:hypothetical protein